MGRRVMLGIAAGASAMLGLVSGDLRFGAGLLIALAGMTVGVIIIETTDRWLRTDEKAAPGT